MRRLARVRCGDAAAVASLAASALPDPWSERAYAEELARPGTLALWLRDPEPAGFLLGHLVCDELHVLALAVVPDRRRDGIGRTLVEAALRRARCRGARVAHLEVREGNAAARALYAGLGFLAVGRRRRYYRDGEDAVLLTRSMA